MRQFASRAFWEAYAKLPDHVRALADKNYVLLKEDPQYPSLHFKKIGRFWSVRIGLATGRWPSRSTMDYCGFGSAPTRTMIG